MVEWFFVCFPHIQHHLHVISSKLTWSDDEQLVVAHFTNDEYPPNNIFPDNLVIADVRRRASSSVSVECDTPLSSGLFSPAYIDELLHVVRHPRRIGTHVVIVRVENELYCFNVTDVRTYQPVQWLRASALHDIEGIVGIFGNSFKIYLSPPTGSMSLCVCKRINVSARGDGCRSRPAIRTLYLVQKDSGRLKTKYDDE